MAIVHSLVIEIDQDNLSAQAAKAIDRITFLEMYSLVEIAIPHS